jgi:hypothetical protein
MSGLSGSDSENMMFSCDFCNWEFDVTPEEYAPMLACAEHPCCHRCQVTCACGESTHGKGCTSDCWDGLECYKCNKPIAMCCIGNMLDEYSRNDLNSREASFVHYVMAGCWECNNCYTTQCAR